MPSHPELLDYLAERFVEEGWSLKKMVRFLVTSRAYQMASTPSAAVKERDPENVWLSHIRVRRLEAEAIRDALLSVSGRLDLTMEGPGVGGDIPRRSIYVGVRRTNLDAFLEMFDAPKPFTTIGRRDATNVPGQSLALLNDPFVIQCAETWAGGILEKRNVGVEDRIREMFLTAFSRKPTASELEVCRESLAENGEKNDALRATLGDAEGWRDLAQSLFNMKEFLYLK